VHRRPTGLRAAALVRGPLPLLGPAFVAAIAYIDPGNFATNITAGSSFGYLLVWVVVAGNLMAMLIQYLSAKAGIATGRSLPELCRTHFPPAVSRGLWVQAELVAIATDLAEVLGGAIALQLLFGLPLLTGGVVTAVVAFGLQGLQSRGVRPFEVTIAGLMLVILLGFLYSLLVGGVDAGAAARGLTPRFAGTDTLLLATGMLGATIMPHVIYLHGALTQHRYVRATEEQRRVLLRSQRLDVVLAMTVAGVVNLAMLVVAAQVLAPLPQRIDTIEAAHDGLSTALGPTAALLFALALLASGLAASGVGTLSGQVVMQGFVRRRVPGRHPRAGAGGDRLGRRADAGAGGLPGGAVLRHPLRAGPAGPAHPPPRRHGVAGQHPADHRRRLGRGGGDQRPERHAHRAHRRGLTRSRRPVRWEQ
jgi:manganese transport protein